MCASLLLPAAIKSTLAPGVITLMNTQFALSALSIGAGFIGQQKQADAMYEHQTKQGELQRQIAADAARHQYMGLLKRQSQAKEAAAQDVQSALGKTMSANAAARVAAAAGGVSGTSVNEGVSQFGRQFEEYTANRMTNLSWEEDQILASMEGVNAQQAGRNAASIGDPIAMPNALGALGALGGAAFDAAGFWGTQFKA
jgi:hypothetical protein